MHNVSVALDWYPNTNHTGLYAAREFGWFKEAGVNISILSPHVDGYSATPASRVANDPSKLTFACTPSESVISWHTHPTSKPAIVAVATLLQDSCSAVVTLKSSGIDRPAKLDGKRYASYGARYEGRIVQQMIINDGGKGDYIEDTPPMLGIWNTLLKGESDATWVFSAWEGVEARRRGVELNTFKLEDYGIAYGYSPVLVAHPDTVRDAPEVVRGLVQAAARGYAWAAAHPDEAAELLVRAVAADTASQPLPTPLDLDMVRESQAIVSQHYLPASGSWGVMDRNVWQQFLSWMSGSHLLTSKVQSRAPQEGVSASLDALRQGDAGEEVPLDSMQVDGLFTNVFAAP